MLSQGSARSRRARQREMGHQGVLPQVGRPTVVVTGGVDALIQAGVARGAGGKIRGASSNQGKTRWLKNEKDRYDVCHQSSQ